MIYKEMCSSKRENSPLYSACLVAKLLNKSEAKIDLVMIQTLLAFQMQITLLS